MRRERSQPKVVRLTLAFRRAEALDDRKLVCDAWARSYANSWSRTPLPGRSAFGFVDPSRWVALGVESAKAIIARDDVTAIVAYEDQDWAAPFDAYGFIVTEPPDVVWFAFVKDEYRGRGFARALFAAAGIDPDRPFRYRVQTRSSEEIAAAGKMPLARFDPTPIRRRG